jgi:opacity protein-like surface antigen
MKKVITYIIALFLIPCAGLYMPTQGSQPIPTTTSSSPLILNNGQDWRVGFGLAAEYINFDAVLKLQASTELRDLENKISHAGKHIQGSPSIELGKALASDYYLGLLVSWRYAGAKNSATTAFATGQYFLHEFKLNYYTNLLLKAGYKFNQCTMAYGLFGPSLANWRHTSKQYYFRTLRNKLEMSKATLGLGLGVGFEYLIRNNFALSIDYTYHFHKAASRRFDVSFLPAGAPGEQKN